VTATNKIIRMNEPAAKRCVAVNEVVALIHDKWTVLVLGALHHEKTLRYGELRRAIGGISQRMLTLSLKTLEQNGLVRRSIFATVPPRVEYELTAMGTSLSAPLRGLLDWSLANRAAMAEARRAYAKTTA
jgi:DNA-binding HxlR family transcriptional regulator